MPAQTLLASLSIVVLFAGCGSNADGTGASNVLDAAQQASPADASFVDAAVEDFGHANESAPDESVRDDGSIEGAVGAPDTGASGWRLVWSDEFEGPAGSPPDASKWNYVVGPSQINHELEYYTDRPENSALDGNGNLVITARQEPYMGRDYTSARIDTSGGKFEQAYGRFEARLQLPTGQGLWPAFFAFGNDIAKVGWPRCGEIDIMENRGNEPTINHGSLHGPGYSGANALTASYTLASQTFAAGFHRFAVEWEVGVVRFYVDDDLYETRKMAELQQGMQWVMDHPMYLILNVAVGGGFPGNPDATSMFPQTMIADYVRVYTR